MIASCSNVPRVRYTRARGYCAKRSVVSQTLCMSQGLLQPVSAMVARSSPSATGAVQPTRSTWLLKFVGRFMCERPALAAVALTTDTSALTAIGNDYGYEKVFARQVDAIGRPGDVAIAISTSGRSPNLLAAVTVAKARGMTTVALTGRRPNPLASEVHIAISVPSPDGPRVQECQLALEHVICECVEAILFPDLVVSSSREEPSPVAAPTAKRYPSFTKIVTMHDLEVQREAWRREQKTVAWTNGCFDLLHVGHLQSLEAASQLGDVLVVGVNDDDSVRVIKGPGRPVVPASERAALLAAMEAVDRVVIFGESTPEECLRRLRPDIHCKGSDYEPPDGKPIPERTVVESYGGQLAFLPLVRAHSSSSLIDRVRSVTDT